jgi:hypothetical protein
MNSPSRNRSEATSQTREVAHPQFFLPRKVVIPIWEPLMEYFLHPFSGPNRSEEAEIAIIGYRRVEGGLHVSPIASPFGLQKKWILNGY